MPVLVVECADPPSGSFPTADRIVWWMESMSLVTSGMHSPVLLHCPFSGRQYVLGSGWLQTRKASLCFEEQAEFQKREWWAKCLCLRKWYLLVENWQFIKISKVTSHSICFLIWVSGRHYTHTSLLLQRTQVGSHSFQFLGSKFTHNLVENFIISTNKWFLDSTILSSLMQGTSP